MRFAALGADVPGHRQKQQKKQQLDCVAHFTHQSLIVRSQQNLNELVT